MALTVWRIVAARHADRAFDGEGARRRGGRWNHPGTPVVYTSATLSLAALETFVHVDADLAPDDLVAVSAQLPETIAIGSIEIAELGDDWRGYPAPDRLKDLGTRWLRSGQTAVLAVPSAVIPQERNFLLHPAHADFASIRIGSPEPFASDFRCVRDRR